MRELTYLQRVIVMTGIVGALVFLVFGISQTPGQSSPERLEYYGADAAGPDDWEWLASQGVNAVFLGVSGYGVGPWFYQRAREAGVKLFVWPLGSGEEYTPWHWNGGNSWDISEGEPLLRELVQNHDVVIAVMSLHEPYWRGGQGAIPSQSQKALADEIRAYTASQGHELEILNLVTSVHYWQDDPVIPGQFDWAGIWLHCWDAEGTEEQARERVRLDREYVDAHGLDVKLVFLVQAFGIDGTAYRMPAYEELRSLSCDILGQDALEGFLYYSWGQAGGHYTDWLKNHPEMHAVIKDVYDNCVEIGPPPPTETPEPTSTATPTNTPRATPTSTPTDAPTPNATPVPGAIVYLPVVLRE